MKATLAAVRRARSMRGAHSAHYVGMRHGRAWLSTRPPRNPEPLPEDNAPATWQRVAQLLAGSTGACTVAYFLLFADFGEGEHCFRPVRLHAD